MLPTPIAQLVSKIELATTSGVFSIIISILLPSFILLLLPTRANFKLNTLNTTKKAMKPTNIRGIEPQLATPSGLNTFQYYTLKLIKMIFIEYLPKPHPKTEYFPFLTINKSITTQGKDK